MTVNERLILFLVIEEVTSRRLSDGVPPHRPRRDIKLPASPPCGLLDGVRRSMAEGGPRPDRARTLDSQWVSLRSRNVSFRIDTLETRRVEG